MKKTLLALAVLSAFAGAASAQSSVTLSGSLDAGLRRVAVAGAGTGTVNDWRVAGSQSAYNNFTLSGVEDLGAGARAFFTLNHRFTLNNGVDNGFSVNGGAVPVAGAAPEPFWRNAFVGIGGGFGDVRIGRILMPLQDMNGGFDAFNIGTVATLHTQGINATNRANNALSYRSPNLGGVSVMISAAANEGQLQNEIGANAPFGYFAATNQMNTKRPMGVNVRYAAGPVNVGFAYDKNSADMKTIGVYGSFDFGRVKLMGQFEKGDNYTAKAPVILRTTPDENVKAFSLGLTAPLGPVLLRTGVEKIKGTGINGGPTLTNRGATKFGFGGDYILSKRTNLYTDIGKWSGNRVRTAVTGSPGVFNTAAQKVQFDFGVTHKF
jgi:predicted porin